MNLVVDIGNTSVKTALFDGKELVTIGRSGTEEMRKNISIITSNHKIENIIISSVASDPSELIEELKEEGFRVHHLTGMSNFPFKSEYKTPETLGVDRLAAAAGGVFHFGNANMLIIDAGSALTFDLVAGSIFRGGTISPGMEMRFKALHTFTGRLPLCSFASDFSFPASGTTDAIAKGVMRGIIFELNEYIRTFSNSHSNPVTILTGGDSMQLSGLIKGDFVILPNLVLEGLNYLIELNRE